MSSKKSIVAADDGGLANEVGPWAKDKHKILCNYVGVTSAVRKKFINGPSGSATYIDPFCAMGRAKLRNKDSFIDGSSVGAWNESLAKSAGFSQIHIGDLDSNAVDQCAQRLGKLQAPLRTYVGTADETVKRIVENLHPLGYHFAFLDPYNLASLPFTIIETLCKVKRMDVLIHVSSQDLQRNFGKFVVQNHSILDSFAPGWRNELDPLAKESVQRTQLFNYWQASIRSTGKTVAGGIEHVTGTNNQTLYFLVLISANPKAEELWEKIRNITPQDDLFA